MREGISLHDKHAGGGMTVSRPRGLSSTSIGNAKCARWQSSAASIPTPRPAAMCCAQGRSTPNSAVALPTHKSKPQLLCPFGGAQFSSAQMFVGVFCRGRPVAPLSRWMSAAPRPATPKSTLDVVCAAYPDLHRGLVAERVIDGEATSQRVLASVAARVKRMKEEFGVTPGLAVVLVRARGGTDGVTIPCSTVPCLPPLFRWGPAQTP